MGRRIHVTEDDIKTAVEGNSHRCMVAEAIKRAEPDAKRVMVDTQAIRYTKDGKRYTWFTPPQVQQAIIYFDEGVPFDPFTFELRSRSALQVREARSGNQPRKARVRTAPQVGRPEQTRTTSITIEGGRPLPRGPRRGSRKFGLRSMSVNKEHE